MEDIDEDDLDIYINNQEDIIEDELITYLAENRADRKVSNLLKHYLRTNNPFFIINIYIYTNLLLDLAS
jgi:hypothetical protein